MIISIILLFILLILSGVFSSSETALFTLDTIRVRHMVEKKIKNAELLMEVKQDPHKILSTILICNNLVNIGASAIATSLGLSIFLNSGFNVNQSVQLAVITGAMTFLVLCFGEISPKTIAARHAEKVSLFLIGPLIVLSKILFPIIFILDIITKAIVKLAGEPESRPLVTEDELRYMVDVGAEEGEIKKKEREMITNIMEFDLIDVREVMTPRPDVYSVDGTRVLKEAMPELMKKNFSRYPVYEKDPDNIIGVVLMKDLNEAMNKKKSSQKIKKFTKKVLIVPETKHIDKLLPEFQKKKKHMAVVVDEHGNMAGIITIEDLLEQIVGEIYDETDKVEREIVKIKPKLFKVKGHANIDDVNKELKLGIKVKDEYDTISGFVLDKLGRIPKKGEILKYKKTEIKVDRVEGNRITELKITKK